MTFGFIGQLLLAMLTFFKSPLAIARSLLGGLMLCAVISAHCGVGLRPVGFVWCAGFCVLVLAGVLFPWIGVHFASAEREFAQDRTEAGRPVIAKPCSRPTHTLVPVSPATSVTILFEYIEQLEAIVDRLEVGQWLRLHPMTAASKEAAVEYQHALARLRNALNGENNAETRLRIIRIPRHSSDSGTR